MYSMICIFAIHLSVEVHLSCFHNLAIVNSASTKTRIFEILQMAHLQMEKNELVWVSFAEWERVAFRSLMGNIRRIESKPRFFDSHVKACSFTRWLVNLSVLLSASRWNYIPSGQFHIWPGKIERQILIINYIKTKFYFYLLYYQIWLKAQPCKKKYNPKDFG